MTEETQENPAAKLWELIEDIHLAMLTTVDPDGSIRSRPMATQQLDFDGDLWFFTSKSSGKNRSIEGNPEVNVAYAGKGGAFVSVSGRAEIVVDREKARELWHPAYQAFFPKGLKDPELVLMRVRVHGAEYWEAPSAPARVLLMAGALLGAKPQKMGENKRLNIGH